MGSRRAVLVSIAVFVLTAAPAPPAHTLPRFAPSVDDAGWVSDATTSEASRPASFAPRPGHVALTFDDGPDPVWTPRILDLLDRHGIRATFFVQGWLVEKHPCIVLDMVRRGHSVQNHTWNHPSLPALSRAAVTRQLERTNEVIHRAAGVAPSCVRPPYGHMSRHVASVAAELGLAVVLWQVDPMEYTGRSVTRVVEHILTEIQAGDIVLA